MGLASGLQRIEAYAQRIPMDVNPAAAQLAIINPLSGSGRALVGLFRTHPETEDRVARLREMRV
jgi:heat shock protein HtpX